MGWDGMHLGLMGFAAVREAAARAEERSAKMLSSRTGRRCGVRIEGAQRLPAEALPVLLQNIQTEGPCLCSALNGELEGRFVVWPPRSAGCRRPESAETPPRHDLIAEALAEGLVPSLQEFAGIHFGNGPFRLKSEFCHLPEDWGDDAEAWVWSVHVRSNNKRYLVRVALFTPACDALSLFRALCLEEAA